MLFTWFFEMFPISSIIIHQPTTTCHDGMMISYCFHYIHNLLLHLKNAKLKGEVTNSRAVNATVTECCQICNNYCHQQFHAVAKDSSAANVAPIEACIFCHCCQSSQYHATVEPALPLLSSYSSPVLLLMKIKPSLLSPPQSSKIKDANITLFLMIHLAWPNVEGEEKDEWLYWEGNWKWNWIKWFQRTISNYFSPWPTYFLKVAKLSNSQN